MKKHINIPIFIPHLGCPNQCVFCNQRTISGVTEFDIETVKQTIEAKLSRNLGCTPAEATREQMYKDLFERRSKKAALVENASEEEMKEILKNEFN